MIRNESFFNKQQAIRTFLGLQKNMMKSHSIFKLTFDGSEHYQKDWVRQLPSFGNTLVVCDKL